MKLDFDPGFDITPLSVDEGFRLGAQDGLARHAAADAPLWRRDVCRRAVGR